MTGRKADARMSLWIFTYLFARSCSDLESPCPNRGELLPIRARRWLERQGCPTRAERDRAWWTLWGAGCRISESRRGGRHGQTKFAQGAGRRGGGGGTTDFGGEVGCVG